MTLPGQIGPYPVQAQLGVGGLAAVYRATDSVGATVALKVFPTAVAHAPIYRERFAREAQTLTRLEHPALVPVLDIVADEETLAFAMPLLAGGALPERLRRGPLPPADVTRIVARVASALDLLHTLGLLHRNLRASAVLFDDTGAAYLSDFGLPTLPEVAVNPPLSVVLESLAYMPPEQIEDASLDRRADVYALGVLTFEMLTGQRPYWSSNPDALAGQHVNKPIPGVLETLRGVRLGPADIHAGASAPPLTPPIEDVMARALAKTPADRYETAGELATALGEVIPPDTQITPRRDPPPPSPDGDHDPHELWDWDALPDD